MVILNFIHVFIALQTNVAGNGFIVFFWLLFYLMYVCVCVILCKYCLCLLPFRLTFRVLSGITAQ